MKFSQLFKKRLAFSLPYFVWEINVDDNYFRFTITIVPLINGNDCNGLFAFPLL